ncbi:hypothetical protein [Bernardetia sp. MNP-M8]|uniref:hypothetical protein n=1 Tax=Bernardetia sp. MNP-M8 TaxID=3127470 RepID=UPI0030D12D9F
MAYKIPLESGEIYHIYNRGIDGCNLFYEQQNYTFFLEKYAKYVSPVMDTFAYCLLGNHFHLLVRIKSEEQRTQLREKPSPKGTHITLNPSRQLGHFFNTYANAINKKYKRTGSLFEEAFERKKVTSDSYLTTLIDYIHKNPVKHGFTNDFTDYPHSSYHSHLSEKNTKLDREYVLEWFGGRNELQKFHIQQQDYDKIKDLIIEFD